MTTLADPGPVFAALADPTRRSVLTRLASGGAASATMLARELPVTRQAVVQHLAVLDAAGLTRARGDGREVRHEVRPEALTGGGAVDDDDRRGSGTSAWRRSPPSPRSRSRVGGGHGCSESGVG